MSPPQAKKQHDLRFLPVDQLMTLRRNPQYLTPLQMDSLKSSIARDGFVAPILVRKLGANRYEVVSGNHRLMAANELGLTKVPCVIAQMSAKSAKRLAVNLNTVHGEPSAELLAPFLAEMDDDTLKQIHLEDSMLKELMNFDDTLTERLEELELPDGLNHDSPQHSNETCTCPVCGREHLRKNDV